MAKGEEYILPVEREGPLVAYGYTVLQLRRAAQMIWRFMKVKQLLDK